MLHLLLELGGDFKDNIYGEGFLICLEKALSHLDADSVVTFLDAPSHLYMRLRPSVGPSVGPSDRPSVRMSRVIFEGEQNAY